MSGHFLKGQRCLLKYQALAAYAQNLHPTDCGSPRRQSVAGCRARLKQWRKRGLCYMLR